MLAPEFERAHQAFNPYALRQFNRGEAMVRMSGSEGELAVLHEDPLSYGGAERVELADETVASELVWEGRFIEGHLFQAAHWFCVKVAGRVGGRTGGAERDATGGRSGPARDRNQFSKQRGLRMWSNARRGPRIPFR